MFSSRRTSPFFVSLSVVVLALALWPALAGASKAIVSSFGSRGASPAQSQGGVFSTPVGVAVNNSSGDVYVADSGKNRIQRFNSAGNFISTWGFDVIQSGKPGDLGPSAFEVCTVAADCKVGIATAVSGVNPGGELSSPQGLAIDQASGNVYVVNRSFRRIEVFSATGAFIRTFGQDVVQAGKAEDKPAAAAKQSLKVDAAAGQFKLTFKGQTTSDLPFNATAAEVQAALQALSTIGAGNATVSGGPGNEGGTTPYAITFAAALANSPQPLISAANGTAPLSGGAASATVTNTTSGSSGFEVCTSAANCKQGVAGTSAGAFAAFPNLVFPAVAPAGSPNAGDLLVPDREGRRVQEFSSSGAFVRAFGFDVAAAPTGTGAGFEICSAANFDVCQAGSAGSAVGQFNNSPSRVAEDSSGLIYAVEEELPNLRVQKFTPSGANLLPSILVVNNETQAITVRAGAGQFKLTFNGSTTTDLPFNATAAEVQAALNALPSVQTVNGIPGGSVSVSGGPGDASGSSPYVIVFAGSPFAGADAPQITAADGATPLSGGSGAGSNRAIVTTTAQGAPNGTNGFSGPFGIAIGPSDKVLIDKEYLPGSTPSCLNTNAPSVQEGRILELSSAGALLDTHLGCVGSEFPRGLAINQASGRIYFSTTRFPSSTDRIYVIDNVTPPTATIDPVSEVDAFSATLRGHVNPQGSPSECRFDYISKAAFDQNVAEAKAPFLGAASVPCEESPGEGSGPIAVSAQLKGTLNPNTAYVVRLVAQKPAKPFFGEVATASSNQEFSTGAVPPPSAITGAVAPRGTTTARLSGLVNPNASPTEPSPTTAHFEYGTAGPCSANPCEQTAPQGVGDTYIKPGEPFAPVSAELEGLQPNTTYHYRLVAMNDNGTGAGEDRTFTTRAEPPPPGSCANEDVRQAQHTDSYLPDCRAMELVNQPDKGNQNVQSHIGDIGNPMMSADGEAALWSVTGGAPGGTASAGNTFLAERTASGWTSRNLVPPADQQLGNANFPYTVEKATPDLQTFLFNLVDPNEIALGNGKTLVRLDREGHQDLLAGYEHPAVGEKSEISDDGAHVLLVNPDLSGIIPNTGQLEDIGDGTPETLSLMPPPGSPVGVPVAGGAPSACGLDTAGNSFAGQSGDHNGASNDWNPGYRMIEAKDASRVYFEAKPDGNCAGPYGLYLRNRETETTTPIDYGTPSGEIKGHVEFIRATPDGQSAYFASFSQLDPADQNSGADVYRWEEGAGQSSCLTCVVPNANVALFPGSTSHLLPVMVSDDFSHVYFQSKAQLVPGHGKAGEVNTYALSDGQVHFVAGEGVGPLGTSSGAPTALLSANGNVLVFLSKAGARNLTADELPAQCTDPTGEIRPCEELFRYEDRDGALECISCRHEGETSFSVAAAYHFRMSADGGTVAFATLQSLLARDVNNDIDVYEWREGATGLLSDGVSSYPRGSPLAAPQVRGIDPSGQDILFSIAAPGLTGFEQDGLRSLYDARIGGGFAPPSPPTHCAEDSCQGPLQAPPPLESAASANQSRGNPVQAPPKPNPCRKKHGKAKRRCLRKHKRQAQRQRASAEAGRGK